MIILKDKKALNNRIVTGFGDDDAIRISGRMVSISHVSVIGGNHKKAHWDGKQFIPIDPHNLPNRQYAGASLNTVRVNDCTTFAEGTLQGYFGGDGLFNGIHINNNMINTASAHQIAFNGLLSGTFLNNTDGNGEPALIELDNWRIGGGMHGGLWVLSMKGARYKKVRANNNTRLKDTRGKAWRKNALHVADLDVDLYKYQVSKMKYPSPKDPKKAVHIWCEQVQNLALEMGTVVE